MDNHSRSQPRGNRERPDDIALARDAMEKISASRADNRDDWLKAGMALHSVSPTLFSIWEGWSQHSEKFEPGECARQWKSFKNDKSQAVNLGTLIHWAREDSGDQSFGKRTRNAEGSRIFPTVEAAAQTAASSVGGDHVATWKYEYEDGSHAFSVVRINLPAVDRHGKRKKTFRPIRPDGEGGFEFGTPQGLLPLYRLRYLPRSGRIYVPEGEKAADALVALGLAATTTAHGASSAARSDIRPLVALEIVIAVDNDSDGTRYADRLRAQVLTANSAASIRILALPGLPEAGDAVEFIAAARAAGKSDIEIRAEIEAHADAARANPGESKPKAKVSTKRRRHVPPYTPFPTHLLPEPLRTFVERSSTSIGCDPAVVALPALAAAASAIGNTRRIRLKHGWSEPAILWVIIVASSGMQKTPAFALIQRAIDELQREAFDLHVLDMARYEDELKIYDVHYREWVKGGGKGSPPQQPVEPIAERLYCSDTTIEALAILLLGRWRGLLLLRDELSGWISAFDQYRPGQGSDVAYWLEMHGGRPILVDRKTGKPKRIYVPRAAVCIAGCIQPMVLARSLGNQHFENGLAARFLIAYPPRRPRRWTDTDIPSELEASLTDLFARLYSLAEDHNFKGEPTPHEIELTPTAQKIWIEFFNEHGDEQASMIGNLAAAWSKLEGYAARLALVIHCLRWAGHDASVGAQIDEHSLTAGIALSRWFGSEAKRAYAALRESEEEQEERALVELIRAKGGTVSVRRWHKLRAHATAVLAEEELDRLVEQEYGDWVHPKPAAIGGRPSKLFVLRPDALEEETPDESEPEGVSSSVRESDAENADIKDEVKPGVFDNTPNGESQEGVLSDLESESVEEIPRVEAEEEVVLESDSHPKPDCDVGVALDSHLALSSDKTSADTQPEEVLSEEHWDAGDVSAQSQQSPAQDTDKTPQGGLLEEVSDWWAPPERIQGSTDAADGDWGEL